LRADGLPPGASVAFSSNPAIGTVNADVSLGVALTPGTYSFDFVASRNGVEKRLTVSFNVVTSGSGIGSASISFTPTPVTAVPGEALSYGLQASSSAFTVARGGSFPIDVQVQPHGGFVSPIAMTLSTPAGWQVTASSIGSNTVRFVVTVPSATPAVRGRRDRAATDDVERCARRIADLCGHGDLTAVVRPRWAPNGRATSPCCASWPPV
jgi:hypothetical protein